MLVINNTKKTIHIPDWSEKEKPPPLEIAVVSIVVSRPAIEPTNINMRKNINIKSIVQDVLIGAYFKKTKFIDSIITPPVIRD